MHSNNNFGSRLSDVNQESEIAVRKLLRIREPYTYLCIPESHLTEVRRIGPVQKYGLNNKIRVRNMVHREYHVSDEMD